MRPQDREVDGLARLKKVQARVRQLLIENPRLAAEFRKAFGRYEKLYDRMHKLNREAGTDWKNFPPSPAALNRLNLTRFSRPDLLTIALYWLGGLVDVGRVVPLVPKPTETGDAADDAIRNLLWKSRLPIRPETEYESEPPLSVGSLPPSIAEEFLDIVEVWVREGTSSEDRAVSGHGAEGATNQRTPIEPPDDAYLSETDLAACAGVNQGTLRKHLPKWRKTHNDNDWIRVPNPGPRDPHFTYRWGSIRPLLEKLPRTANVSAKKN